MATCFMASLRFVHKWQVSKEIQIIDSVYFYIVSFEDETTHILGQKSYRYFFVNIGHKKNGHLTDQPSLLWYQPTIHSCLLAIEIYCFEAKMITPAE